MTSGTAQSIWVRPVTPDEIRETHLKGCGGYVGIELTAIGPDWIEARMPATGRTADPVGNHYAGAIAILAETLGSVAASLCLAEGRRCVGQSLDVHYFAPITSGPIRGRASPVSITDPTQVWRIDIRDESETLVSAASLTLAILSS